MQFRIDIFVGIIDSSWTLARCLKMCSKTIWQIWKNGKRLFACFSSSRRCCRFLLLLFCLPFLGTFRHSDRSDKHILMSLFELWNLVWSQLQTLLGGSCQTPIFHAKHSYWNSSSSSCSRLQNLKSKQEDIEKDSKEDDESVHSWTAWKIRKCRG